MEVNRDIFEMVFQLLPGFVMAWVFYGLTPHPRLTPFERIAQSLVFTVIIKCALFPVKKTLLFLGTHCISFGPWDSDVNQMYSVILAMVLGLVFASLSDHNTIHRWLADLGITSKTSFPSEWYSVFRKKPANVVLHLKGGRLLGGYPEEYPDQADRGQFVLSNCEWKDGSNADPDLKYMIIAAADVEYAEVLSTSPFDESKGGQSVLKKMWSFIRNKVFKVFKNHDRVRKNGNGNNISIEQTHNKRGAEGLESASTTEREAATAEPASTAPNARSTPELAEKIDQLRIPLGDTKVKTPGDSKPVNLDIKAGQNPPAPPKDSGSATGSQPKPVEPPKK